MNTIRTNIKTNASTQYSNFDIVSMCEFNGEVLGAGPDGLFKLNTGCFDGADQIDAHMVLPTSTLGNPGKKRARQGWIEGECTGAMSISLTGDDKTTIGPYTATFAVEDGAQRRRVVFGKGLKWNYGKFRIANVNGSKFSIDAIDILIGDIPISGR
jgi:hypothetical protein